MESNSAIASARAVGLDPHVLALIIFPTEKCNLRCVYCYEQFPNVRLNDDTARSIKKLISNRSDDIRSLSISWFGGEPLLEKERVIDISRYAQDLAAANRFRFVGSMTTNAVMLDYPLFENLVGAGIQSFQISLDGDQNEHDRTRISANGAGTFSNIWDNIYSLKNSLKQFDILVRVHFHSDNIASVMDLLERLSDSFYADRRFRILPTKVFDYGWIKDKKVTLASKQDSERINDKVKQLFPDLQIAGLSADSYSDNCCYASMPNHFTIRANGKVQKCTVALYDESNDVGELTSDGEFKWHRQERLRRWSAGLLEGDLSKMRCPWGAMRRSKTA